MTRGSSVSPFRRPLAVTLYYASHAAAALLLALPATAVVSGPGISGFSEGDRLLFQPGGVVAADVARALWPTLPAHAASSLWAGTLLALLLLVPHAAVLSSLSSDERESQAAIFGRAIGRVPALIALSGLALLAQAVVLFATLTFAGWLKDRFDDTTTRSADLAYLVAVAFGLLVTLAFGVVRDLGRAAIVRDSLDSKAALFVGLRALARAPGRSLLGWLTPSLAGVALVALAAVLTTALDVSRPGAWRVWLVLLVHQLVAYALCFCRAYWLTASLGLVGASAGATGRHDSRP
jgi:hypothetical protein